MSIEEAIADRDWELLRTLILQKHAKSRQHVGLGDSSELNAFQLVAFYESDYADDLLAAGFTCDLHSACALGREELIKSENNPEQLGFEVEHLTPMGWAIMVKSVLLMLCSRVATIPIDRSSVLDSLNGRLKR